jgi:hypothetical protein
MEAMISIKGGADKEALETLSAAIRDTMTVAFNCHADQETMRFALSVLADATEAPHNISIASCHLVSTGDNDDS